MHEIVSIQLGRKANYVGTHFWNAQESYHTFGTDDLSPVNHDIHFRQGIAADGSDTYLPRTVLYDLKGGFGSLARLNAVGADVDDGISNPLENGAWQVHLTKQLVCERRRHKGVLANISNRNGSFNRIQNQETRQPSPYLTSLIAQESPVLPTASTTHVFSDFASNFYHPRSLVSVAPAEPVLDSLSAESTPQTSSSSSIPGFKSFSDGHALFSELNASVGGEDLYDRDLRPWIEECDALQGLEMFASTDDAWAGFASAYIEDIRDQLGKGSIWVWGLAGLGDEHEHQNRSSKLLQTLTQALALASFNTHASLYVPLTVSPAVGLAGGRSMLSVDHGVLWHTSALVSAAIESATLPTRLREMGDGRRTPVLGDWEDALGDGGKRRIAGLELQVGATSLSSKEIVGASPADQRYMSNGHGTTDGEASDARLTDVMRTEDEADEQESVDRPLPIDLFEASGVQSSTALTSTMLNFRPFRSKTFARIDTYRGPDWALPAVSSSTLEQDLRYLRRGRPVVEKFQTKTPLFPLLTTFPHIFTKTPPPRSGAAPPNISMHTCLRTSGAIANWVRELGTIVRRTPAGLLTGALSMSNGAGGPAMEIETLRDELGTIAEAYVEGWDSADEYDLDDLE